MSRCVFRARGRMKGIAVSKMQRNRAMKQKKPSLNRDIEGPWWLVVLVGIGVGLLMAFHPLLFVLLFIIAIFV